MTESQHQQELFAWAELAKREYPELAVMFAIPNGGARSKATAGRLKAEGVKAGIPDICLPIQRSGVGACYIELKTPKTPGKRAGRLSPTQRAMIEALEAHGSMVFIAYGWEDAKRYLLSYLKLGRQ